MMTLRPIPIALCLAACGCAWSDESALPRAEVSGKVTLNGKPLGAGAVWFIPIDGTTGPTTANVDQGSFTLPTDLGPIIGKHRAEIDSSDTSDLAMDDEDAIQKLQSQGRRARIEDVRVPAVYNKKSTLTADISAEVPNELSFELVSNAR